LIDIGMPGVKTGARKKMALALEGDEAANPLGMADELVAEAAFNPAAFDYSRFMPQPAADEYEAPQDDGPEVTAPHWGDDPYESETGYQAETPPTESDAPALDAPDHGAEDHGGYGENRTTPETAWPEPSAWQAAPEPEPSQSLPAEPDYPDLPAEPVAETAPFADETIYEPALHEEPAPAEQEAFVQPAGHSLRSRMRIAPVEEDVPSAMDKLQASIARFFKRVKEMLLRR